jgi:hypothetical protein
MNDNQNNNEEDIGQMIENLASERLVPLYYGADKLKPKYDNFSFSG